MDSRVTNSINFNTNVRTTEFQEDNTSAVINQRSQSSALLPSKTSVTEEIKQVFRFNSVEQDLLTFMENACKNPTLRSAEGFQKALRQTLDHLKRQPHDHASKAAQILEQLLEDKMLLDWYRAMIIDN